jgi:hypothetical protein
MQWQATVAQYMPTMYDSSLGVWTLPMQPCQRSGCSPSKSYFPASEKRRN